MLSRQLARFGAWAPARQAAMTGLGPGQCRQLETAGLLHDIGRAGVPSSVWDRPGPLSAVAWEQVRLERRGHDPPQLLTTGLRRC